METRLVTAAIIFDHDKDDKDEMPWYLIINSPDKSTVTYSWAPESLVRHAVKWARQRGIEIEITVFWGPS